MRSAGRTRAGYRAQSPGRLPSHRGSRQSNALDVVQRRLLVAAAIELRGAWISMPSEMLGGFCRGAVLQECGDAGSAERVIADLSVDVRGFGAAAHHGVCVLTAQRLTGEGAVLPVYGLEERCSRVGAEQF